MRRVERRVIAHVGAIGVLAAVGLGARQEPSLERLMQRKLDHAHSLLEALITEDFETLEESSRALSSLSEEAGWFVLQTEEYARRSAEFRRSVAEIEASAKERNLEGAALGYVDMTLKCVQCHRYLRGTRRARAPGTERFRAGVGLNTQPARPSAGVAPAEEIQ